jgi:hypothetical protein
MSSSASARTPPIASPLTPYVYKSLPIGNYIRILELEAGSWTSQINFKLLAIDMTNQRPESSYEAISYTWGTPERVVQGHCDGCSMMLTENLAEALRQTRFLNKSRLLWADGVCINQEDLQERTAQVKMMALVYQNAKGAIVSLGVDNGDAEEGFNVLNSLSDLCERQSIELGGMENVPNVSSDDLHCYANFAWTSCRSVLQKPWFSRVWIVQEVGLAKRVVMLCGRFTIQWHNVVQACLWLTWKGRVLEEKYQLEAKSPVNTWVTYSQSERDDGAILQESALRTAPKSFFDVLFRTRFHGSTNPRDKVYAFLGHPTASAFLASGTEEFPIDYVISYEDIYTFTALNLLTLMGNLRIFSTIQHTEEATSNNMPSWVPRFHQVFDGWIMGSSRWPYYCTSLGQSPQWTYSKNDKALNVRGLEVDTIAIVSKALQDTDFLLPEDVSSSQPPPVAPHCLCELEKLASQTSISSAYSEGCSSLWLSYTLVFGVIGREAAEDNKARHLENYIEYLSQLHQLQVPGASKLLQNLRIGSESIDRSRSPKWRQWMLDASRSCHKRRFFITKRGFFGLGPSTLKEGDVCSVLFGATVPFILRRKETGYDLLGEAYLHGIMRGEAVEMWKRNELHEQTFKLV